MSAISMGNIKIYGSHGGCSTGPDGPSNMGLEDLAMFTSIPNFTVLYPSDSTSTFKSVELAANWKGSVYIRGTKAETKTVYAPDA
jgi:transketolase